MRIKFLVLISLISLKSFSQEREKLNRQIDSLSRNIEKLQNEIKLLNKEIEVKKQNLIEIEKDETNKEFVLTSIKETKLIDNRNSIDGKVLAMIKKGETILVLNYESDYYYVKYKEQRGYVYYAYFLGIPGLDEYKNYWTKKNEERKKLEKQNEITLKNNERFEKLKEDYGYDNAIKIMAKKIWIGMTSKMALASLGSPEKVNKSTYSFGVHEQWIYKDKYLYFEDNILKSWSDN